MSDQWFYQAFGEEHGPVSFEQLRAMASKYQLTPQQRVRTADDPDWQEARRVRGLFPHLQNADEELTAEDLEELDFESLQVVSQERQSEWASLDDLDIQVSDAPSLPRSVSSSSDAYGSRWTKEPSPAKGGDAGASAEDEELWVCDVLGVQLGPMPLSDMRELARKGEIGLDDPVRRAEETQWQSAKTVEGLFPGFEFHSEVGLPEIASSSPPAVKSPPPSPALPTIGDDFELAIDNLSSAEIPQAPADLKPAPQTPRPAAKRPPQPTSAPAKTSPVSPTPAVPAAKAASPEEEKKAQLDKWLSEAVPSSPSPAETQTDPQPAASGPAAPSLAEPVVPPEDRAARLRAEFEARAAASRTFTPPTPQKKVKSSGPGMGEQVSGLVQKLKENPKFLGVFVVLGLVLLVKYLPWSFGPSDQGALDQVKAIGNTYKEMRTRKASQAEFDTFKKESLAVITPLKSELIDAGAGINDRPKQELYWACGKLEKMLAAGPSGDVAKEEKAFDTHLATAQSLINGEPPPMPTDGESTEANSESE